MKHALALVTAAALAIASPAAAFNGPSQNVPVPGAVHSDAFYKKAFCGTVWPKSEQPQCVKQMRDCVERSGSPVQLCAKGFEEGDEAD